MFSAYLPSTISDLNDVAFQLVRSRLVEAAMINDGRCVWRTDTGQILKGEIGLESSTAGDRASIVYPDRVPPFVLEGLFTASLMKFGERHAFGSDSPAAYVRAILGECRLEREDRVVTLYPVLKLYESGVLLLEFRMFSPEVPVTPDELTSRYVKGWGHVFSRRPTLRVVEIGADSARFSTGGSVESPTADLTLCSPGLGADCTTITIPTCPLTRTASSGRP